MTRRRLSFGQRHAWIVAGVTFFVLLAGAGQRSAPGVLMTPLQQAFGWDRALISFVAALGILIYGLVGPFAAALMQTVGICRTMIGGLVLMAGSTFASLFMSQPWHYILTWGVLSGLGSGAVANVLGASVVNRWFATNRGLVMGALSASTATGSLIFLPLLAALSQSGGWRPVALAVSLLCLALIPFVAVLVPERPSDVGALPHGATEAPVLAPSGRARDSLMLALNVLANAAQTKTFWLLFATFFVCGLTTNGLVGTHLISFCGDHGLAPVAAAGLLATMGLFDLIGTTLSGWLTDRFDPRKLLFFYYSLRGASLIVLPFTGFDIFSLSVFAVFYGLDWLATVPPTLRLVTDRFGDRDAPIVFGWTLVGHQAGAAVAAFGAGWLRQMNGSYLQAFVFAGMMGVVAGLAALAISRRPAAPALA